MKNGPGRERNLSFQVAVIDPLFHCMGHTIGTETPVGYKNNSILSALYIKRRASSHVSNRAGWRDRPCAGPFGSGRFRFSWD